MRCGNCKGEHETVMQVRTCYGITEASMHAQPAQQVEASMDEQVASPARRVREGNPGRAPWKIQEGHYAIDGRDGRQTDFYRVDRPTEGKWSGWTFLKMVVGGKPDVRVKSHDIIYSVLEAIQKDPAKAAQRYGVELGQCSRCNRHLTDEVSRSLGMGPDCREKMAHAA